MRMISYGRRRYVGLSGFNLSQSKTGTEEKVRIGESSKKPQHTWHWCEYLTSCVQLKDGDTKSYLMEFD